jgi:hypothetical protein
MAVAASTATSRNRSARKPAAAKRAPKAIKAAPRRARTTKPAPETAAPVRPRPIEQLQGALRDVAYAQLGVAAGIVEEVGIRMIRARLEAPKRWVELVKRGEQVQRDIDQAGQGIRLQITQRITDLDPRAGLNARISKLRDVASLLARRPRTAR